MPKLKASFGQKVVVRFLPTPIDLPPLTVETPRQEMHRLLDKAVHERGAGYLDRSHRPVRHLTDGNREYGCIVGYMAGLKGISVKDLQRNGLDHYLSEFGWDTRDTDRRMVSSMIAMNDFGHRWGDIQHMVRRDFPISA